jgi:undecaprenyl-diphosphatase
MDIIQAIVFGAVQGLTEFLPISSTAHLILLPWFMGWQDPGLVFDVALHLGTLIALLVYFRGEWFQLIRGGINLLRGETRDPNARLLLYIVFATIPAGLAGALLEHQVETTLRSPYVISAALIVLALVLVYAERIGKRQIPLDKMTMNDAMTIGCAQAIALVPGVSRSGVTLTAALFRGMTRPAGARFSFFLSTPIIGGAVAKKMLDVASTGIPSADMMGFVVGIATAGIVGYLSIAGLLRYLAKHDTFIFIYYRIALGIVVALMAWRGMGS